MKVACFTNSIIRVFQHAGKIVATDKIVTATFDRLGFRNINMLKDKLCGVNFVVQQDFSDSVRTYFLVNN